MIKHQCPCEDCTPSTGALRRFLLILMVAGFVLLLTLPAQ